MKRNLVVWSMLAGLLSTGLTESGSQEPGARPFMKEKSRYSQQILDGLALKDFAMIAQGAEALARVSAQAEFQMRKTPEYLRYSEEFRQTATSLARHAREKNLDGATFTYVQLTVNCVNCHMHLREKPQPRKD
jgi:hypothetical protein